jgi:[ribosomal protein S5]-alanine N-acetyltransferase
MDVVIFPFPALSTERLILRQIQEEDRNELFLLRSDEKVLEYIDRPKAQSVDECVQFIRKINEGIAKKEWLYWAITLHNKLIGTICLWNFSKDRSLAEVGYELMSDYQGKGYMQEALTAVIKYGFVELKLHSIEAYTHPNNLRSIHLLEKNHFIWKTNFQERDSFESEMAEMAVYSLRNAFLF